MHPEHVGGARKSLMMAFCVMGTPVEFMDMINDVVSAYLGVVVLLLLDDIVEYSHTMAIAIRVPFCPPGRKR